MGEVAVPLAQWFREGGNVLWDSMRDEQAQAFELVSARRRRRVTGRVFLQFGIVLSDAEASSSDAEGRAREIVRSLQAKGDRHLASLMGVPAVSRGFSTSAFTANRPAVPRHRNRQDQAQGKTLTEIQSRRRRLQAQNNDRLGGVCVDVPRQRPPWQVE
jgi:hypothetical protein